jgi:hypothetical protein
VADATSLYVLLASPGLLARVSLLNQTVVTTHELAAAGCGEPSSLDVDTLHGVFLVGCRGGRLPGRLGLAGPLFLALNASSGDVLYSSPIPRHPDGLVYLPPSGAASGRVFLSCGTDSSVILFEQLAGGASYRPLEAIATRLGAKTLAVDPARRVVYTYAPSGVRRIKQCVAGMCAGMCPWTDAGSPPQLPHVHGPQQGHPGQRQRRGLVPQRVDGEHDHSARLCPVELRA